MSPTINVLIANRHPITAQAYKNALILHRNAFKFKLNPCLSNTVASTIAKFDAQEFPLMIVDTNLSYTADAKIKSVESLCTCVKNKSPKTKMIVTTSFNDNYRLSNILSKVNPDGLLLKADITGFDLFSAVRQIIAGNPYYSTSVTKLLRKKVSQKITIDIIDTEILKELSNGSRMMELLKLIPLTKSGIEKRKRRLKSVFQTKSNSDRELVLFAKENGYI